MSKTKVKSKNPTVDTLKVGALEVYIIQKDINSCAKTNIDADTFISLLELQALMESINNKRANSVRELMLAYGIARPVRDSSGSLVWMFSQHPKKSEIEEKLKAINNQIVELKPVKFMSSQELNAFTNLNAEMKPFSMAEIHSLAKVLLKK